MSYKNNQFIVAQDLSFNGVLHDVKKSKTVLQPIFECFTNALEAIKIKQRSDPSYKGLITLKIYASETTVQSTEFNSLLITDNGIGFNEEEFKRFNTFKLTNKGFKNLGSGRLQYLYHFGDTTVKSVFEEEGKFFEREFIVSKKESFLKQNAIVKHTHCKESTATHAETTVTFSALLENSSVYNELNEQTLKEKLLERYIHYFCYNKDQLPDIKIEFYIQAELKGETSISQGDIPTIDKTQIIPLNYSRKSNTGIEKIDKTEDFTIDAFTVASHLLKENKISLVSKGEVIEESDLTLESLSESDSIKGNKFLFLVSSHYIDIKDTNLRGVLNIPDKDSFSKELFADREAILMEDIQEHVNKSINAMYPEIEEVKQKHRKDFAKLKEMFLLDDETAKDISISINDSENDILKKFYEAEAKKTASITHYVVRRKLVLDLFQKIVNKETDKVKNGGKIDENILHNLIFQQSSNDPMKSDLWLVNEEYIYFKGVSEKRLDQIELEGVKVLKEVLSPEEQAYSAKQGGDARLNRTDILLFPAESKCIILELKAPKENISDHLNQINRYASLINNLSIDTLKINTFYGYLIGESIDADDVIDNDSDFIHAPNLNYIFRPYKRIIGKFGRPDGSLYTEIIKYSTLLERAKQRNKVFIDKLK